MTIILKNIRVELNEEEAELRSMIAKRWRIKEEEIASVRIVRSSIDARRKSEIHLNCSLKIALQSERLEKKIMSIYSDAVEHIPQNYKPPEAGDTPLNTRPVIIGSGPCGMFAALVLAYGGYRPIVVERGMPVDMRTIDVAAFRKSGVLKQDSNILFGEGGAGTFSDGKLTTRVKDPLCDQVLAWLVEMGAPAEILVQAKPHIGTDKLRLVVQRIRHKVEEMGGIYLFDTKLTKLHLEKGILRSLQLEGKHRQVIDVQACILAIGHSARETFFGLADQGIAMESKRFAVGVRIEHPQSLIDQSQFGKMAGHPRLGAATYQLSSKHQNRGVYSFCMCPGGEVVPSASEQGGVVTNGMSSYARNMPNANAAIIVQVGPEDFGEGLMDGIRFQQKIEHEAFNAGGGRFVAPAQRVEDFLAQRKTTRFGDVMPSYRPGVAESNLWEVLPGFCSAGIAGSIPRFAGMLNGFDLPDAVLTAVESRTSSPVRILRDAEGQSVSVKGLYPAGEGAGYAGGIVSAAVDGIRAAHRIIEHYAPCKFD